MSNATVNATDKKWETVTYLIDKMQAESDKDNSSIESLVQCLAEGDLLSDCLTKKGQLTVVYWPYNKADYKIVLGDASLIENVTTKEEIHKVILNNSIVSALSCDECLSYGFYNCGSLIIVPMRIDKKRSIGAFIFQSELGGTLEEEKSDRHILDTISDRLAIFIRYVNYRDRADVIQEFFDNSFKRGNSTVSDKNIIQDALNFLGKRFSIEEVSVFLRHPFDKNSMFAICEDGKLLDNFHSDGVRNIEDLSKFFGDISVEELLATDDNVIEFKGKLPDGYHSYAIAPMRTRKQHSIGFFVLRNKHHECAYDDDKILLSRFADITAVNLRNNHRDKINDFLKSFNKGDFDNYFFNDQKYYHLYDVAGSKIEEIYGFVSFIVISIEKGINKPKVEYQYRYGKRVFDPIKDVSLNLVSKNFKNEIENMISNSIFNKSPIPKNGFGKLFPMSCTDSGLLTKIFIIESSHSLPSNLRAFLGDLISSIGIKQSLRRKNAQFQALTDFGKEITAQKSLVLNDVYDLAYKYTEKAMSASNMYIALLDEETQEISFPRFYQKKSDDSEVKQITVASRPFDKNSDKKGRTECILATGEPILIFTKEQSMQWYAELGHENKIEDTYASWVGVPIVSEGRNIGVIVLYHVSEDYLYSQSDVGFLEAISSHISDLLSRLNLEKTNRQLEKMQKEIAEKEALLSTSLVAQDITHRLNNSLGSLGVNLKEIDENFKKAIALKDFDVLQNTRNQLLPRVTMVVNDLLHKVHLVAANQQPQDISLKDILSTLVKQITVEKKLDKILSVKWSFTPDEDIFVKVLYRNILNCLHAIIDNAATALYKKVKSKFHMGRLYLGISVFRRDGFVYIEVVDNGIPIPKGIEDTIFELGVSSEDGDHGYGLWRSRVLAKSLGGDLILVESNDERKVFCLSIPAPLSSLKLKLPSVKPLALVVEDDEAWQEIISRWLEEDGFDVEIADDINSARLLFKDIKRVPKIVILDIALNDSDGGNVDGLSLIADAKELGGTVKIFILTAYPNRAMAYKDDCTYLIEKVRNGNFLTKEFFLEKIRN